MVGIASPSVIIVPRDFETIQEGIDASVDGDTVLVKPGTYYENINFNLHNIILGSMFFTTGNADYISTTIIDGSDAGSVVTFNSGEDSTAMIIGFSITNGRADYGGGILCTYSSPTIAYNEIFENETLSGGNHGGGGIYSFHSSSWIVHNNIHDNTVPNYDGSTGGAIKSDNSALHILNNIIAYNSAFCGSGIAARDTTGIIKYNRIHNNSTP